MSRQKIKFKLKIIIGVPLFTILFFLISMANVFSIMNDFWHYRCHECGMVIPDPKKLMTHLKLGCFDVS